MNQDFVIYNIKVEVKFRFGSFLFLIWWYFL